jgi:hypothetical protein
MPASNKLNVVRNKTLDSVIKTKMSFLDILDTFSNLSLIGDKENGTRRPRIYILFFILPIPSILWFVVELKSVMKLQSPLLFLGLSTVVGLILTIGTIILIFKLDLIERIGTKDFFAIFIPLTFLTVSIASFVTRTY